MGSISVFDMFRVGIGPSSSHTVGPMRAAAAFLGKLRELGCFYAVERLRVELMGSLAATGRGHATDTACELGLMGEAPETCDIERLGGIVHRIAKEKSLMLGGVRPVAFDPARDILFRPDRVPAFHTNAVEFTAFSDGEGKRPLYRRRYYSIGGGFVVPAREENPEKPWVDQTDDSGAPEPYPFHSCTELVDLAEKAGLTIPELVFANECSRESADTVRRRLDHLWHVMSASIERGRRQTEPLPGPFRVARRAKKLADELLEKSQTGDPLDVLDWVNVYAMAVSEENAAGGRIVTAPTNGAAGVIPAVVEYYVKHTAWSTREGVRAFLLTAGAVGRLYKENASISGAEVGCQGEVGVACSMAAAGLTAALHGTNRQIENAAEIGMEHNLGLTCDPVAGQVQIPCIERNAVAAVKAIVAARMALRGNGRHYVSLDQVIRTMLETGRDMPSKYKETSRGGLAVTFVQC